MLNVEQPAVVNERLRSFLGGATDAAPAVHERMPDDRRSVRSARRRRARHLACDGAAPVLVGPAAPPIFTHSYPFAALRAGSVPLGLRSGARSAWSGEGTRVGHSTPVGPSFNLQPAG
jgi:hypothetical protein